MKTLSLMLGAALVVSGWTSEANAAGRCGGGGAALPAAQLNQLEKHLHSTKTLKGKTAPSDQQKKNP